MMNLSEIYVLRSIIDEINVMIDTTLLLDRRDIERAVFELKSLNGGNVNDELVRAIVHGLQHFDIFEQRLRHVVEINHAVCPEAIDVPDVPPLRGSNIFALNQLQYESAWRDYLSAISELQSIAAMTGSTAYPRLNVASNGKLVRAAMPLVSAKFAKLVQLTQGKGCVELERYRASVELAYSTEKERSLMAMFALNPDVTFDELNASIRPDTTASVIDLF
ncbi:hypothetical protein WBG78_14175 [Chryseolinea sp. T2]|uniref:hypothetical protein n=1 Tax=Chryseolinea sp. T2 TaxID=3129255 RepID=UPI003077FFBD